MMEVASEKDHVVAEVQKGLCEQVSSLCLFFEAGTSEEYQKILKFVPAVKSEFGQVEVVVFYTGTLPDPLPGGGSLFWVGKKDFNLFRQKSPALKAWLGSHHFDMLISFAAVHPGKSHRVLRNIKARFTAGPNPKGADPFFDLNLGKPGENMDFGTFFDHVKHYFSELNIDL